MRGALASSERDHGSNSLQTGLILVILAGLEQKEGRHALAAPLLQRARTILRHRVRWDRRALHRRTARAGRFGRSAWPARGGRSSDPRSLGSGRVRTPEQACFEAWQAKRFAEALPQAQAALAFAQKELGPDHPATAVGHLNVGAQHDGMEHFAEAEPSYKQALVIFDASLGADSIGGFPDGGPIGWALRATEPFCRRRSIVAANARWAGSKAPTRVHRGCQPANGHRVKFGGARTLF